LSLAKQTNWSNTIQNIVANRARRQRDRLEAIENEKRRIDVLEATIKTDSRNAALSKAYSAAYTSLD
jgi:hypothetical protein